MMMPQSRIWYVIADGGRIRIVEAREERSLFRTREEIESVDIHRRAHDIGSDRPGRSHERATVARHAQEPREDIHKAAKLSFAQEIADLLNKAGAHDEFDRLVIVAPAPILDEIKRHLDTETAKRVTAELQRDLTKVPDQNLKDHLSNLTLN